jgi:hypothetical protein
MIAKHKKPPSMASDIDDEYLVCRSALDGLNSKKVTL